MFALPQANMELKSSFFSLKRTVVLTGLTAPGVPCLFVGGWGLGAVDSGEGVLEWKVYYQGLSLGPRQPDRHQLPLVRGFKGVFCRILGVEGLGFRLLGLGFRDSGSWGNP